MEDASGSLHRKIYWALALSLLLHVVVWLHLGRPDFLVLSKRTMGQQENPVLSVRYRSPVLASQPTLFSLDRTGAAAVEPAPAIENSPVTAADVAAESSAAFSEILDRSPATPIEEIQGSALDLSLPVPGPDLLRPPLATGETDNGAIVMNTRLLQHLQKAKRRTGYAASKKDVSASEYQGGSWVEYFRDGNRCFRVVLANPLEPGSQEMWYRVACPD